MKGIALDRNNHYSPLPQVLSDDDDDTNDLVSRTTTKLIDNHELPVAMVSSSSSYGSKRMSGMRWLCFGFSVILAVIAVLTFLWVLPCDLMSSPCRPSLSRVRDTDWRVTFPSSVFTSGLQLVDADQDGILDIVLGFRPLQGDGNSTTPPDWFVSGSASGGIMVLNGRDGHKMWSQTYFAAPKDVLCNAVDVNSDGVKDCILVGDHLFSAINISNDHTHWYVHSHPDMSRKDAHQSKVSSTPAGVLSADIHKTTSTPDNIRPKAVSAPAVLTDLTGDDVRELVVTCQIDNDSRLLAAFLWIVSGGMGELLGHPVALPGCVAASQPVTIPDNGTLVIAVLCETDGDQSVLLTLSLDSLWESSTGSISSSPPSFLDAYRFPRQEKQLKIWAADVNGDGVTDVVVTNEKGKVTALHGTSWDVLWAENVGDVNIGSCTLGPIMDDGSRMVLLTLFPRDCQQGCNSVAAALSGKNGSRIFSYNSLGMVSPVLVDTPTSRWPSILAFKEVLPLSLEAETSWKTMDDDEANPASVVMAMQVRQALLLLIGGVQSQAIALETNVTMCYIPGEQWLCLPASATQVSGAIGDVNGDDFPDLISVMTEAQQGENTLPQIIVTKTSLGRQPDTDDDEDAQLYPNNHGPTNV